MTSRTSRGTEKRPTREPESRSSRTPRRRAVESSEEPDVAESIEDVKLEDEEGDDEALDEEEESETRCLCGQLDPPDEGGLFIQCEECSVWQHGFCVSISDNVPDKYWCEECRPMLHSITVRSGEKLSKYLPVQPKESRKPTRRSAALKGSTTGTEDELESAAAMTSRKRRERATQDARYEAMIQRVMEESKRDANQTDGKDEEKPNGRSSRSNRRRKHEDDEDEDITTETPDRDADDSVAEADSTILANGSFREPRVSKLKKSTPEQESSASETQQSQSQSQSTSHKPKKQKRSKVQKSPQKNKDSSIDFNKPTKPRLPQQRTTINEMRRRVAAILEFIDRTQQDMFEEESAMKEFTKYVDDGDSKIRIEALTENHNTTLKQMDKLTSELLAWEVKFGERS